MITKKRKFYYLTGNSHTCYGIETGNTWKLRAKMGRSQNVLTDNEIFPFTLAKKQENSLQCLKFDLTYVKSGKFPDLNLSLTKQKLTKVYL